MSIVLQFSNLFHTGFVVDDVDAAKVELTDQIGVSWGPEGETDMPVWLPTGAVTVSFRFAYTAEGPHRLELVRQIPRTVWTVVGQGQAHHVGYWCDDVASASDRLAHLGAQLCAKVGVDNPIDPAPFVMHRMKSGPYIELVDVNAREAMFGA